MDIANLTAADGPRAGATATALAVSAAGTAAAEEAT